MFADLGGRRLHYERTGQGRPLILLHGNGESWQIFRESMAILGRRFTVYAVDLAGHGESDDPAELHYAGHAADIAAFSDSLKLEHPALYGFSDGGIVGLMLAVSRPGLLSELVVSGVNLSPGGLKLLTRLQIRLHFLLTGSEKDRLMLTEPHIRFEELSAIRIPPEPMTVSGKRIQRPLQRRFPAAGSSFFPGPVTAAISFTGRKKAAAGFQNECIFLPEYCINV